MSGVLTMEGSPGDQASLVDTNGVPRVVTLQLGTGGPVDASAVTYTPGNVAVWPIPPPATVADALDILAALHASSLANAARVPVAGEAENNSIGPFAVVPSKSGVYLAWASVELVGAGTVAGQANLTILVDTVDQGQPLATGYTVGSWGVTMTQLALVTLNRSLAHNWELAANTGDPLAPGHILAGRAKLLLLEL